MAREKETRRAKTKARILLVEDHAMVRFGLTQLINQQADLAVCGEADSVPGALEAVANLKPDLAIVDLTLKGSNGLELIKTLAAQYPKLSVLVVSMHDESFNAELALHAGAKGYIMKEEAIEKMLVALRRVLSGKIYLSDNITLKLLQKQISGRKEIKATPVELLSHRELQVFQLIGEWRQTHEIAKQLHLSIKTVEYYHHRIKEKLDLRNATELRHYATDWLQRKRKG